ncbi:hypothetical protein TNCV_577361 [Trichonephila clavipes]|uniref:Uncharacterized protein n=1 Tax=Trichonephila clavipes TaxID=2585209 RepID=A0A8X6UWG2_TRICX|nr:hypothetical protein TNCV_577361 [Trichonephila clavipes]
MSILLYKLPRLIVELLPSTESHHVRLMWLSMISSCLESVLLTSSSVYTTVCVIPSGITSSIYRFSVCANWVLLRLIVASLRSIRRVSNLLDN